MFLQVITEGVLYRLVNLNVTVAGQIIATYWKNHHFLSWTKSLVNTASLSWSDPIQHTCSWGVWFQCVCSTVSTTSAYIRRCDADGGIIASVTALPVINILRIPPCFVLSLESAKTNQLCWVDHLCYGQLWWLRSLLVHNHCPTSRWCITPHKSYFPASILSCEGVQVSL